MKVRQMKLGSRVYHPDTDYPPARLVIVRIDRSNNFGLFTFDALEAFDDEEKLDLTRVLKFKNVDGSTELETW